MYVDLREFPHLCKKKVDYDRNFITIYNLPMLFANEVISSAKIITKMAVCFMFNGLQKILGIELFFVSLSTAV